jgi:hypothetical protein
MLDSPKSSIVEVGVGLEDGGEGGVGGTCAALVSPTSSIVEGADRSEVWVSEVGKTGALRGSFFWSA